MPDERDVVRLHRFPDELHACLFRRPVTLPVVALHASSHEILPGFFTKARFRNEVINSERDIGTGAVLASMTITAKDIFAREDDSLVGDMNVDTKAHDAWERHHDGNSAHLLPMICLNKLCLAKIQKNNRFLNVTYTHRLIILIEDEHFAAQFAVWTGDVMRTED